MVDAQLEQRLAELGNADPATLFARMQRGIEKESLRITPQGRLAQTPHPTALGSALTHPCITTDYSEALLELITAPSHDLGSVLDELESIHRFVYHHIGDEMLWTDSMPCVLEADHEIPVARYGSSNVARMKTTYRVGLGYRYGRLMQTIAGIHYNFSLDDAFWSWLREVSGERAELRDFKTACYFALIRNFHRYSWLLPYLFGASPALCSSFVKGRGHGLEPLAGGTLHAPFGTSLRMGDLGYQSDAQRLIDIPYNNLEDYLGALTRAVREPHPPYVAIGTRGADGEWLQLNTSLLQIENEFYSTIRPKRVTQSGEAPRRALRERGVEYVEVRCLDIDPFEPTGISAATARFVDAFLVYCVLRGSPPSDAEARARSRANLRLAVNRGREPGLMLAHRSGRPVALRERGLEIVDSIAHIATLLDRVTGDGAYTAAVLEQRRKLEDPERTPSARVMRALREHGQSFYAFAMAQSRRHRAHFLEQAPAPPVRERFERWAHESLEEQRAIEQADRLPFEEYLAGYFRQ